jgi:ribulose-phosphate 3-epimerase
VKKVLIYPSILSSDFARLEEQIKIVEEAGADGIHLDIMDGHFVPNITIGPSVIRSIRKVTDLVFWAHFMVDRPSQYIEDFRDAGVNGITIHCEIEEDWISLADRIRDLGMGVAITMNPETPVHAIERFLDRFERVLIMTVHPGFGGQSFEPKNLKKIRAIKSFTASWSTPPIIEVDGGIDEETTPLVIGAGARLLIIGSAIYHAPDPGLALRKIRTIANKSLRP